MLCDGNNPVLQIIGAEHMYWKGGNFDVKARDYSALAFRISGNATIIIGEKERYIHANDILYMPQNIAYKAKYTNTEMLVIHFITSKNDSDMEVYSFQNVEQIYKLFLNALNFWKKKEPGYYVYTLSQLYMILGVILEKNTKTKQPEHFLNAIAFINSNYRNSTLSIDMICAKVGISATVFRQLFKKYYQKTPIEYITGLRLEYARSLISNGVSIEDAAYESGFNDSKYFSRVVKKHFGCTPRKLKNYGK
jgi:AraC-like DNA-binding protein